MAQEAFPFGKRCMTQRDRDFLARHRRMKAENEAVQAIDQAAGTGGYADKNLVEISIKTIRETKTGNAYFIDDGIHQFCVPKSQVTFNERGILSMPEWLAKKKGLI